jgi:hypothetical protein
VSESAGSAKRGWGQFGAKPAQSETPVRAAAKRRPPGIGGSGKRWHSLPFEKQRVAISRVGKRLSLWTFFPGRESSARN